MVFCGLDPMAGLMVAPLATKHRRHRLQFFADLSAIIKLIMLIELPLTFLLTW